MKATDIYDAIDNSITTINTEALKDLLGIFNSLTYRELTKPTIQLIITTIDEHDIEDAVVDLIIKDFSKRVKKSFLLVDDKIFGEERKKQELLSNTTQKDANSDLYTSEDMKTPWNIIEDMGFNIYQDNATHKSLFWLKSKKRIGDEKVQITKTNKESLIELLNSWVQEHKLMWNKPVKDTQGNIASFNETLIDFKEADLTRFYHKKIVFDPTTTSNLCTWKKEDCLNSYTAPKMLHIKTMLTDKIVEDIDLFYNLIHNITGKDDDATEYVLHWLAHNYQTKEKHEKMMIFAGGGRTGKGLMMEVINNIYGERYIGIGSKTNNIFDKEANKELKDKLYYHADEIEICEDNWSSVKRHTGTNKQFLLKELYADSRAYPNTANFVFNINTHKGEIPFKIPEQGDLRMCCFETFSVLIDQDWWEEDTYDILMSDDMTEKVAKFLSVFPYDNNLLKKPYDNDLRRRMVKAGQSYVGGFAKALQTQDYSWLDDNGLDTIVWYNYGGERAKDYTWTQHLDNCYSKGYITLKDAKSLFTQLFPTTVYKTTQMIAEGMVEKHKAIETSPTDRTLKDTRYFELPHLLRDTKRSIKDKLKGKK